MSTGIQWTDETWNPVVGCEQVSAGCDHCYAKTLHDMRHRAHHAGKKVAPQYAVPFETVQVKPDRLTDPLSWRKPRRIFVNSVADLFHKDVTDWYIDQVFASMALAQRHTFQILTKRAGRMRYYLDAPDLPTRIANAANAVMRATRRALDTEVFTWRSIENAQPGEWANRLSGIPPRAWPLPNVWLGVSVENQAALSRIGALRQTPAAIRFVSFEPLLEGVTPNLDGIDWAIIGGESGKGARPFEVGWARDLVASCRAAGVAPFVKQLGAVVVDDDCLWPESQSSDRLGAGNIARIHLRDSHGGDMDEWPTDLRIREFPSMSRS